MDTPVRIPVCPAEHFFLAFKPTPELKDKKLPNVRDYDSRIYLRQMGYSFLMGCFEKQARPWDVTKHSVDPDWNQIKVRPRFHLDHCMYIYVGCLLYTYFMIKVFTLHVLELQVNYPVPYF